MAGPISHGERNCPFLILMGRPVRAAARIKSLWRHKNAGIWITSSTFPAFSISPIWCTSDRTGNPVSPLTFWMISSPFSMPGPLNEFKDVRLALSYDVLKIIGISSSSLICIKKRATSKVVASSSITQGPEIRKKGPFELMAKGPIWILFPICFYEFVKVKFFTKTILRVKHIQHAVIITRRYMKSQEWYSNSSFNL